MSGLADAQRSRLSELIAETMGLHFPRERWDDLERGFAGAAQEFGFDDASKCVEWLLSTTPDQAQLQVLASHLTIGETYFFRDQPTIAALSEHVLPELISTRRGREQRLRLWSAACCTGEEPYTLAILLHQLLPDLPEWQITITATDINGRFLRKAEAGVYTEWSFRDTPAHIRQRYFTRIRAGHYAIVSEIRKLVKFEHLNLVEDVYPTLATDTNAMDLILCRNALMYFTPLQTAKVVRKLHRALVEGGWLAVAPAEASQSVFAQFTAANLPGVILYRRTDSRRAEPLLGSAPSGCTTRYGVPDIEATTAPATPTRAALRPEAAPLAPPEEPAAMQEPPATALAVAQSLYTQGRYEEVVETLVSSAAGNAAGPPAFSLLARALANQGKLAEALTWCERWVAADKLDAAAHYLRAVVLLEQGDAEEARASLQRAVYLDPDFILAHFSLGNIARGRGRPGEAGRHFANALHLLSRHEPGDVLPESDGLTAGRLTETVTSMSIATVAP